MSYSRFIDACCCSNYIFFIDESSELSRSRVRGDTVGEVKEHSLLLLIQSTRIRRGLE